MSQSKKMEGAFQGEGEAVVRERLGEVGLSRQAGEAQGQMWRRWIEVNRTQGRCPSVQHGGVHKCKHPWK